MTYLKKLAEQIRRVYEGGNPSQDSTLKDGELYPLIIQVINKIFKAETLGMHYQDGTRDVPHHSLMTYSVDIEASGDLIVTVDCESWPGYLVGDFWTTPGGSFWDTEEGSGEDFWMIDTTASSITVTDSGDGVYAVVIGGLTLNTGYDFDDLVAWIGQCASTSYLRLAGPASTLPNIFPIEAMSSITATADGFSFSYDTGASEGFVGDVLTNIIESNARLVSIAGAGETEIDIVRFDCCTPSTNEDYRQAQLTLPAMPLNLPMGQGVWRIYDPKSPYVSFIPLTAGGFDLVNSVSHTGLNTVVDGENCYEWFNYKTIKFNKAVSALPSTLSVQLVVADMDQLGPTDLLPIPPESENDVIQEVLKIIRPVQQEDLATDQNEMR